MVQMVRVQHRGVVLFNFECVDVMKVEKVRARIESVHSSKALYGTNLMGAPMNNFSSQFG